ARAAAASPRPRPGGPPRRPPSEQAPAPAANDREPAARGDALDDGTGLPRPPAGGERLPGICDVDRVIGDLRPLLSRRLGGADVETAINREGVRRNDLPAEPERDLVRGGALAGPGSAEDDEKRRSLVRHRTSLQERRVAEGSSSIRTSESRSVRKSGTRAAASADSVSGAGCPKRFSRPQERRAARGHTESRNRAVVEPRLPWWPTFRTSPRRTRSSPSSASSVAAPASPVRSARRPSFSTS